MTSGRMRICELLTFCWRGPMAASHLSELRLRQEIAKIAVASGFSIGPHGLPNYSD
jgi:hypothetical protein